MDDSNDMYVRAAWSRLHGEHINDRGPNITMPAYPETIS